MNMSSTPPPRKSLNDSSQDPVTTARDKLLKCESKTFWTHVQDSFCRSDLISCLVVCHFGAFSAIMAEIGDSISTPALLVMSTGLATGLTCVAFAILTVFDYGKSKTARAVGTSSSGVTTPPATTSTAILKYGKWSPFIWIPILELVFRVLATSHQSPIAVSNPPSTTSAPIVTQQPSSTLAYWHAAVGNLHQIRFNVPSSDLREEGGALGIFNHLKMLTDQAKAAPSTGVDQDLLSMAIRHLAIEDGVIQFRARLDEMTKQNPISPANTTSINDLMAKWRRIVVEVQDDPQLLDKVPQGMDRSIVETLLELEQQRFEQLHEIEIMQAVLQERYPGTKFPLPEIGQ